MQQGGVRVCGLTGYEIAQIEASEGKLRAEVEWLRAQLAQLKMEANIKILTAEQKAMQAEAKLKEYGRHKPGCETLRNATNACDCGWAVLAAAKEKP